MIAGILTRSFFRLSLAHSTSLRVLGVVVRAQGLWNSREEGKWVSMEACKMNREQGIR